MDWGIGEARPRRRQGPYAIARLKVTESVRPYCAVGCGQVAYIRDGKLVDIEGRSWTQGIGRHVAEPPAFGVSSCRSAAVRGSERAIVRCS